MRSKVELRVRACLDEEPDDLRGNKCFPRVVGKIVDFE